MNEHEDGVMIALLPITTDWCQIKLPHMTLVYCGKTSDLKPTDFNEIAKDAAALAAISRPLTLRVTGTEILGEATDRVSVLMLQVTPELMAMRRFVAQWNASKHPGFKPHCTVGDPSAFIEAPKYIAFDRLCLQWGEDQLNFNFNR